MKQMDISLYTPCGENLRIVVRTVYISYSLNVEMVTKVWAVGFAEGLVHMYVFVKLIPADPQAVA